MLVIVFGLFFLAMQIWPPAHGAEAFDWDRYHDRQDACRELSEAQMACATSTSWGDQRLRNLVRALEAAGHAVAIIDTPPAITHTIPAVVATADLVVIPCAPARMTSEPWAAPSNLSRV